MVRVVVDPGVLVSAVITPAGAPAAVVGAARQGQVELVVSPRLLAELAAVLRRATFRRYLTLEEANEYVEGIALLAETLTDADEPPRVSRDPNDDYLVALTLAAGAGALVSGDADLLALENAGVAVVTPRDLLALLG